MNTFNKFRKLSMIAILFSGLVFTACSDDDDDDTKPVTPAPPVENEEEVITDVKLIFTNIADTLDKVEARAQDPDGEGVLELQILDTIRLDLSKTYQLSYEIFNNLETPGEDIREEISEEDLEHQLFYGFTNNAFSSPAGDGNIDAIAANAVTYNDLDSNNNPVGLLTTWVTPTTPTSKGYFRVMLQHQPDLKTSTSDATVGDTDFDLQFVLEID